MLPTSTVAKKLMMAATGQLMLLFVILHVAGNSTIFFSGLNAYAAQLRAFPPLLWAFRLVMLAAVLLHVYYAVQLTLENSEARPGRYAVQEPRSSTFGSRNMIWTGALIGTFLVYHLLQFTFQVTDPATSSVNNLDAAGRPDVNAMVVAGLGRGWTAVAYLAALTALWLHLDHGIQSSFQTWGLNGERSFPVIRKGSGIAAFLLLLAYAAIPLAVVAELLK